MLDHITLSASPGNPARTQKEHLNNTEETQAVVSDVAASIGKMINRTSQEDLEITSSIELPKISTMKTWQEREGKAFYLFIGRLHLLEQQFTLREREEFLQTLEKHPHLGLYLLEIHRHIAPYFPGAQFFLRAAIDPEIEDDRESADEPINVVISVVTRIRPREALDRLRQFYKDWWLNSPNLAGLKEKISFNLECV